MGQSNEEPRENPPPGDEPEVDWESISDEGRRQRKVSKSELESLRRELRAQEATDDTQTGNQS